MSAELDFGHHIKHESTRFHDVLAGADPAARVPTCPDWNAADLLWHLSEVQLFWTAVVRERLTDPAAADDSVPERPHDYGALLELCRAAGSALLDALANAEDHERVWTWFPDDQSVGFIRRRQAHEALIHRLDAELTVPASVTGVDAQLATDGVMEVFDWMYGAPPWATPGPPAPVGRVETTDTQASWVVGLSTWGGTSPNTGTTYADEPCLAIVTGGKPSFTVRGPAADLDAWLWNRSSSPAVALGGDYLAFEQIIRTGVQ